MAAPHSVGNDLSYPLSKRPHALLIPYPFQGHINPMIELANLLASYDFVVTFVNTKRNHDKMLGLRGLRSGTNFMQVEQQGIRFVWIDDGLPPDFDFSHLASEFGAAVLGMKDRLETLIENLSPSVTCLIYGSFFTWSEEVGSKFRIPTVFFWTQSAAVFSIYKCLPMLISGGFFPYQPDVKQPITDIPGVPPLIPSDLPAFLHVQEPSQYPTKLISNQFKQLEECDWVFVNSYYGLEKEAFAALQQESHCNVYALGPLLPTAVLNGREVKEDNVMRASLVEENDECIHWLDTHAASSVIYVSFGSMAEPSCEQMQEIALGLQASQQPFLWSIRPNIGSRKYSDIFPSNFLEDTKERGLIIAWAPQLRVLAHPAVGGFFSHCGWNSTLESLSMGVPLLPLPLVSDQTTNRWYVVHKWKVGVDVQKEKDGMVKSKEVEKGVRKLLREDEGRAMRERAANLSDVARRAMEGGGSSRVALEQFVCAMRERAANT